MVSPPATPDLPGEPEPAAEAWQALETILSLDDVETLARERLPHMAYEYIASGAADEITQGWNRSAYDRIRLRPCVPDDPAPIDSSTELLGRSLPFPIILAPAAYHRVIHPEGELATARGAGEAGAIWIVSTGSNTAIEEIAQAATGPLWFQLYLQPEREVTAELVQRVEAAGVEAVVLTVDTPVIGVRDRQQRTGFRLPEGISTPHLEDLTRGRREILTPERVPVTWRDIEWLRARTRVPLLLKGVMTGSDAARAVKAGADGIIVSNHGGRNLDTLPATIEALPEVVRAVGGLIPALVDGGVRRGTDIVKALGSGAAAVMIGRPYLYGLGIAGAEGVARVVGILARELELGMALCGRNSVRDLDGTVLWDDLSEG